MNRFKILAACALLLILAGCTKKDEAYYRSRPEAAKEKVAECEARLKAAVMTRDRAAGEAVLRDEECKTADKVREALATEERKKADAIEQAKKEAEKKEQDAKDEAELAMLRTLPDEELKTKAANSNWTWRGRPLAKKAYEERYAQRLAKLKADPDMLIFAAQDCEKRSAGKTPDEKQEINSTLGCQVANAALREYQREQREAAERARREAAEKATVALMALPFDEFEQKFWAAHIGPGGVPPEMGAAAARLIEIRVANLKPDAEKTKKEFAQCGADFWAFERARKYRECNAVTNSVRCRAAMEAARATLGITGYGFPKP